MSSPTPKVLPKGLYRTKSGSYQVFLRRAWEPGKKSSRRYFGSFPASRLEEAITTVVELRKKFPTKGEIRRKRLFTLAVPDSQPAKDTPYPAPMGGVVADDGSSSSDSDTQQRRPLKRHRPCFGGKSPRFLKVAQKEPRGRDESFSEGSGVAEY